MEQIGAARPPSSETETRINKVYGARASYIANTLMTDADWLQYFFVWMVVFCTVIFGLNRLMKSALEVKQGVAAKEKLEKAFGEPEDLSVYSELATPKCNADL